MTLLRAKDGLERAVARRENAGGVVATQGSFAEGDARQVIEVLGRTIVGLGAVDRVFGRVDAVILRPTWKGGGPTVSMRDATNAGVPQARISAGGLTSPGPSVFLVPGGAMTQADANAKVVSAAIPGAPQSRIQFGQHVYEFSESATGTDLLDFSFAALKAIGARPADNRWEYFASTGDD